jgi:hypothetical protein
MIETCPVVDTPSITVSKFKDVLQAMALAASRAPSGDNLQPWTFVIDVESQCLEVWLEVHQDQSSLNSGQRMSRISCGAAIECAVCAATDYGWSTDVEFAAGNDRPVAQLDRQRVAQIFLRECGVCNEETDSLRRLIASRTTNRALYDRSPVSGTSLAALQKAAPMLDCASAHWITEHDQIDILAKLAARSDVMLFGESSMRRAFLKNLRFDLPVDAVAEHGLALGTLDVSPFERLTLRALPFTPNWLFNLTPAPQMFARYAGRLIRSSSGLCVISVDDAAHADVRAGRAMLRAWLALTQQGMAVQPMMSCIAMTQAMECGSPELVQSLGLSKLRSFVADFRTALAMMGIRGSPQFLMRFGRAPAPAVRTGRLPLSTLIRSNWDSMR